MHHQSLPSSMCIVGRYGLSLQQWRYAVAATTGTAAASAAAGGTTSGSAVASFVPFAVPAKVDSSLSTPSWSTACLIPSPVGATHGLPCMSSRPPSGARRQNLVGQTCRGMALHPLAQLLPVHCVVVLEVNPPAVVALELVGRDQLVEVGVEADLGRQRWTKGSGVPCPATRGR